MEKIEIKVSNFPSGGYLGSLFFNNLNDAKKAITILHDLEPESIEEVRYCYDGDASMPAELAPRAYISKADHLNFITTHETIFTKVEARKGNVAKIKDLSNLLNKSFIEKNGRFYIENNELVLELTNGDFIGYSDLCLKEEIRVIDCHKEIDRLKKARKQ